MSMIMRVVGVAALFVMTFCSETQASHQHRPAGRISCSDVRYYVAKYSAPVAEMYARSRGATDAQIERARRCLASTATAETGQLRSHMEWPRAARSALAANAGGTGSSVIVQYVVAWKDGA